MDGAAKAIVDWLHEAQGRHLQVAFMETGLAVFLIGCWLLALLAIASRQIPSLSLFALIALAAGCSGLLRAIWNRPSLREIAGAVDRKFGMKQRAETAFEVVEDEGDVARLLVENASERIRQIKVADLFPFRIWRPSVPLIAVVALAPVIALAVSKIDRVIPAPGGGTTVRSVATQSGSESPERSGADQPATAERREGQSPNAAVSKPAPGSAAPTLNSGDDRDAGGETQAPQVGVPVGAHDPLTHTRIESSSSSRVTPPGSDERLSVSDSSEANPKAMADAEKPSVPRHFSSGSSPAGGSKSGLGTGAGGRGFSLLDPQPHELERMRADRLGSGLQSGAKPLPREFRIIRNYGEWHSAGTRRERIPLGLSGYVQAYLEFLNKEGGQ